MPRNHWCDVIPDSDTSSSVSQSLRDTLFGDLPLETWERDGSEPWASFAAATELLRRGDARSARDILLDVVTRPSLETRHYLEAWCALCALGVPPPPAVASHVYGVVVDARVSGGCDTLAAYEDLSARYINFGGAGEPARIVGDSKS